jgi:hypothetical protein
VKYYAGKRTRLGPEVYVVNRNKIQPLRHVCLHSPDGFEWGYGGSGPADLALSILADVIGPEEAQDLYQHFKWDVVSSLPREGWEMSEQEIKEWLKGREVKTA